MYGCLKNLQILDLSRVFAGPWAAQMLADFGADVIKIEHVRGGDDSRRMGLIHRAADGTETAETSSFLAMNRGKKSIAIDLSSDAGQSVIKQLVNSSDVLIENFKVGNLARFGLDYESLSALNPKLIFCSITGFGQTGPLSHLPGYDPIFQAMSGLMSVTGMPDKSPGAGPALVGYSISDITAGQYAVSAILAALHYRENVSGAGQHIDVALLDSQIHAASHMAMNYLSSGTVPYRNGTASQITCPWQSFDCLDKPIMVAVGNDSQFIRLCGLLDLNELSQDQRYQTNLDRIKNADTLIPMLADKFAQRSAQAWYESLDEINIPAGPLNDFDDVFGMPQVQHRELLKKLDHANVEGIRYVDNPVKFSSAEHHESKPPPVLGEHTEEILARAGFTSAEIENLKEIGAVK